MQCNIDDFDISCESIDSCFCTTEELRQMEQEFIDEYKSYNYNDVILLNKNKACSTKEQKNFEERTINEKKCKNCCK